MINYDNKIFRSVSHSENGETLPGSIFHYQQNQRVVTCEYSSKNVIYGHLVALVLENGKLDMRYQQINKNHQLMTGICISTPEILPNGKIRLHERWQWTSGDHSKGESVIEEI